MKKHFDNLLFYFPNLSSAKILDLGSGKGGFVIDSTKRGVSIVGVEYFKKYITIAKAEAEKQNIEIEIVHGAGENLTFPPGSFGFVNMSEVIEHVMDPYKVMQEVYRVLEKNGNAYVSVPNRFGMKDPHYHLYGINFMPRRLAQFILDSVSFKRDRSIEAGVQRLDEMHYFTLGEISGMLKTIGFEVIDARVIKLKRKFPVLHLVLLPIYKIARLFYFDSFHLLIKKR
jgi:ubiquinone/menaquinone biosynthesis C-methylase UbiE